MRLPRLSIARLMVVVGMIAVNLAAGRALYDRGFGLLVSVGPACLALQVALYRLIRTRGRARTFWAGFVICGSLITMSAVWAKLTPTIMGLEPQDIVGPGPVSGISFVLHETPGSTASKAWQSWLALVSDIIRFVPYLPDMIENNQSETIDLLITGTVWFLSQLLIALAGGLLAWAIIRRPAGAPEAAGADLLGKPAMVT